MFSEQEQQPLILILLLPRFSLPSSRNPSPPSPMLHARKRPEAGEEDAKWRRRRKTDRDSNSGSAAPDQPWPDPLPTSPSQQLIRTRPKPTSSSYDTSSLPRNFSSSMRCWSEDVESDRALYRRTKCSLRRVRWSVVDEGSGCEGVFRMDTPAVARKVVVVQKKTEAAVDTLGWLSEERKPWERREVAAADRPKKSIESVAGKEIPEPVLESVQVNQEEKGGEQNLDEDKHSSIDDVVIDDVRNVDHDANERESVLTGRRLSPEGLGEDSREKEEEGASPAKGGDLHHASTNELEDLLHQLGSSSTSRNGAVAAATASTRRVAVEGDKETMLTNAVSEHTKLLLDVDSTSA